MHTILVSAYGCEPYKGSESGVGWNWVIQMAKTNRLIVITRSNNREPIESFPNQECLANVSFYYYDCPQWIRRMKKKAQGLYLYYSFWQLGIIPLVKRLLKENDVNYTMHLSFGSMWMPTFLPLFGKAFIWGPVGGGDCEPMSFILTHGLKQRVMQTMRFGMNKLSFLIPTVLLASVRAKCIICRTENSKMALPWWTRKKAVVMLETAMEGHIFDYKKREDTTSTTVDLITTGRLMESKNVITAIRALAQVPKAYDYKYTIIGSGPMKKSILEAIERYELGDKVQIVEEIPREEVLNSLESADIYLFPSLREGGSWALMEAMAIGLPVVCLNWSGMAVTTDNESAVRLEVTNPNQMAKDMAETIIRLLEDSDRRKKMGEAGRKRIQEVFNWESKGKFMCKLLEKLDKQ